MVRKILKNIFIGERNTCISNEWDKIIHADKNCWNKVKKKEFKSLEQEKKKNFEDFVFIHPDYIAYEDGNHLYLNMIDGHEKYFSTPLFIKSLNFLEKYSEEKILIHCDKGKSRSSSILMLYFAKRIKIIGSTSYFVAKEDYINNYDKEYLPSPGIEIYLKKNWSLIN